MLVITVGNQKGGVGKTAVAANLAGALAESGQRVLAIDLDKQAQLDEAIGSRELVQFDDEGLVSSYTTTELLAPSRHSAPTLWEVTLQSKWDNLSFVPAAGHLDEARRYLEDAGPKGYRRLAQVLGDPEVQDAFDWVIIDTHPDLDILLDCALVASDYVICVSGADRQQVQPALKFQRRIQEVQEEFNPDLELLGVVFNRVNKKRAASRDIPAVMAAAGLPVFDVRLEDRAEIPKCYRVGPVVSVRPESAEASMIRELAMEVIRRVNAHDEQLAKGEG